MSDPAAAFAEPSPVRLGPRAGVPGSIRAHGRVAARFDAGNGATWLADLSETGGFRLKLPRADRAQAEAVLVNTGGGLAGGDSLCLDLALAPEARLIFTTQSAEKVYRSDGAPTRLVSRLRVADAARLDWLPQETILFDRVRLTREIAVEAGEGADVLLFESIVFGRVAMGEAVGEGLFRDVWRVRRGGRLVFAENLVFDGPIADLLARPALGKGGRALATLVHVAPDAEAKLEPLRAALADAAARWGASAWNGLLVARALAEHPHHISRDRGLVLPVFRAGPPPRLW
jgi:urease accessory protein